MVPSRSRLIHSVEGTRNRSLPLLLLVLGAAALLGGCTIAYLRDSQREEQYELGSDLESASRAFISVYGAEGGALSYDLLVSRPDLMNEVGPLEGRTGKVMVSPMGMGNVTMFFPDQTSYNDASNGERSVSTEVVPLDMGGGKVIPAKLEVVLLG